MLKSIKRISAIILALLTAFMSIPATSVKAASTSAVLLQHHPEYSYSFDRSFPAPFGLFPNQTHTLWTFKMNENNSGNYKTAYCIQYGKPANTGNQYDHQNDYSNLSAEQKKLLQRALTFGYNEHTGALYGGSWLDNAFATQAIVWTITSGQYGTDWEIPIADRLLQSNPTAREIYDKIREQIESFDKRPSFAAGSADHATDYEMKYNMINGRYELTLTDNNDVIPYFDFKSSGMDIRRNGNQLLLSTKRECGTLTIAANKKLPKDKLPTLISGAPEYWKNPTQQHMASLNVDGTPEKIPAYIKLHTEKIGNVKIKKTSEDGVVGGMKFKISGNGIDGTYTTQEDGTVLVENLVKGDYAITEVDTPSKYVQPKTQIVTVKPGKTAEVNFNNVVKKFNLSITKNDAETGSMPQGDANLDGAEYNIFDSRGNLADHIKADGQTATSKTLLLGTYKIYETVPPTGYTLNQEPVTVSGEYDGQTEEISRYDTGISDRVIKGQIAVTKFADKPITGSTDDGGMKQPLEGIEFTMTLKSTEKEACKIVTDADGYGITPMLPYGTYRIEETKGAEGYRKIEPFDVQIDQNGKIYKYILENTVYETEVKIVKKDAETGKPVLLEGTQFKIRDSGGNWVTQKYNYPEPATIDTFETSGNGTLVLPEPLRAGDYELYEVQAPSGYTISKEPIPFTVSSDNPSTVLEVTSSNKPVKGTVTIEKQGERFSGSDFRGTEYGVMHTPIYEMKGLQNVTFDILAAEDITTPDGTIRAEKGKIVDTITTGEDGTATSKPLYLGKYQVIEKNTPDGFVLDTEKHPFELAYADQNTELVTTAARVENKRQKAKVSLQKVVETVCTQTYNPLPEIVFGLYARDNIMTVENEVGIEKDSLIDAISIDGSGNGAFKADLPNGKYYVKELTTGNGYVLDRIEYDFIFQNMGNEAAEIPIHVNEGKPIKNILMRGAIEIQKSSEDKKVEGISFKVTGTTEIGTHYEKTFKTDAAGKIKIEGLVSGTYEVSEVKNDKTIGYIMPDSQKVTVKQGGTEEIEFRNSLIRGGFKLLKVDETEKALENVKFGLYTANDKKLKEFFTGKDGTYSMDDLSYGDYYLKELSAPKGYQHDKKAVYAFTVREPGKIVEIKVVNRKIPEKPETPLQKTTNQPKTGDAAPVVAILCILAASGTGLAIAAYKRYKMKRD